jgi:hypothetical protein
MWNATAKTCRQHANATALTAVLTSCRHVQITSFLNDNRSMKFLADRKNFVESCLQKPARVLLFVTVMCLFAVSGFS